MALSKRRRIEPAAAGDTHNTACFQGLGASADTDGEAVGLIGDRLSFLDADRLFTNGGASGVYAESAWKSCADHALLRIKIEYRANPAPPANTREFIVAMRGHDSRVVWVGVFEPDNLGLSGGAGGTAGDDVLESGNFIGIDRTLALGVECRGMKEYKLVVLARTSGVAVDAWGGVA